MTNTAVRDWSTLYRKTSTGAIQQWSIRVMHHTDGTASINTEYGQVGGALQHAVDTIREGKNIGKANETDPWTQACSEANSQHEKKRKEGYVTSIFDAQNGKTDDIIAGGIEPMLAKTYGVLQGGVLERKDAKKMKFPCHAQPKLDGIRCIAVLQGGVCTLWTRTRKPITTCDHIARAIEQRFMNDVVLDGELYNHDLKDDFERVVSSVRGGTDAASLVQYHIYDMVLDQPYSIRGNLLWQYMSDEDILPLVRVETVLCESEDVAVSLCESFEEDGYEGIILRNSSMPYENKRSYGLQKMKTFRDEEFEVVGVKEGRGKMSGRGIFVCAYTASNGETDTFDVKMQGALDRLTEVWDNRESYIGKMLTVRFQNLYRSGAPRFPIGVGVRDYE